MALKNLFDMVKADRYTADGREELIKAQEAETEDARRTYQIGEISQSTGLQKTANGWVKPKSGKAPGAKTESKPLQHTSASSSVQESVYKDIKNNGLEDYTVEEIAKEYGTTRGDAEVIRARLDKESKPAAGVATKALSPEQQKKMESLGFMAEGDSFISESNGRKFEIKLSQQNNPYMSGPSTQAKLYIDGKQAPYTFGGGETLDPNSMVKIEKALKEQGYSAGGKAPGAKLEGKGAGIPKLTEKDLIGKNYRDLVQNFQAGQFKATKETTHPDGSSETEFLNKKDGSTMVVKFDKDEKITSVKTKATESKPATNVKRNESEAVKNGDKTIYRIKGTQYYFDSPEEAESAILAENRSGKTYAKPSKDENVNNIQEALGFKLDMTSGNSMDEFIKKTGENEYAANVWSFGRDSKGTLINKLSEASSPNATIKKENGEWKLFHKDRDGKETVVTATGRQDPTKDAAPRVLTGDTKIRVRKA